MQFLKGYRTTIIGLLTVAAAGFNQVPADHQRLALLVSGVAMIVLRYMTDSPLGESGK